MSTITFMIGNGFDVACGLKSRYSDTYDGYTKTDSNSATIDHFKKIIKQDIETWADFEMQLAEYAHEFASETELTDCISDYKEYLHMHLLQEQQSFFEMDKGTEFIHSAVRKEMADSFCHFVKGLIPNDSQEILSMLHDIPRYYQFISFNYTIVFDELMEQSFAQGEVQSEFGARVAYKPVIHIHGTLNNDMVLGLDDESQFRDLPFSLSYRGKRNLIKPVFIDQYDKKRKTDALSCIQSSNVVCVYGMALGDSDLTWRKILANWIVENNRHHLVYYKHSLSCKQYPVTASTRKMDDEEDYKDILITLLFGEDIASVEQIKKQIHIPTGIDIFNIKETKTQARLEYLNKLKQEQKRPREN